MVDMPEPVIRMIKHPDTNKVMVTVGEDGFPHAIVCGSLRVVDNDTIVVGDALMRRTRENIDRCPDVEFLVWHRKDAYSIKAKFRVRLDTGPLYDSMVKDLERINLWPRSICLFDTLEIWDESASHTAGDRVVRWTSKGGARSPSSPCSQAPPWRSSGSSSYSRHPRWAGCCS
jgi:hypothetical protein